MKDFTTAPISVNSIRVDGYKPDNSTTANQPTIAEIIVNSPALIWGPVAQKSEVTSDTPITTKKETLVDKLLKFASHHAPEVVEVMMGDRKK